MQNTICNTAEPLYNSVVIDDINSNYVNVSDGTKYVKSDKKEIIKSIINRYRDILKEYKHDLIIEGTYKMHDIFFKKCDDYLRSLDCIQTNNLETLKTEIALMLVNMIDDVCTVEWTEKLKLQLKEESSIVIDPSMYSISTHYDDLKDKVWDSVFGDTVSGYCHNCNIGIRSARYECIFDKHSAFTDIINQYKIVCLRCYNILSS